MTTAPCKDCDKRTVGCHSTCEDYKIFRNEVDNLNAIMRKDKDMTNLLNAYNKGKAVGFSHSSFGKK